MLAEENGDLDGVRYVHPGEVIIPEQGFLRGHGTMVEAGNLVSVVSGFVEKTNKLISVIPLNSRYRGDVGDVVVGRIAEVGDKRWKVDLHGMQHSVLQLSSIHLPGGAQRRRTAEDALQMRDFFVEGDLISAEVQKIYRDDSIALHTRSTKYGKLMGGCFISVPQSLVRRAKQHFIALKCGVDIILGNNGYIWITNSKSEEEKRSLSAAYDNENYRKLPKPAPIQPDVRERVIRVRNSICALARAQVSISRGTIRAVYNQSLALQLSVNRMLNEESLQQLTHFTGQHSTPGGVADMEM
eukprot:93982_1